MAEAKKTTRVKKPVQAANKPVAAVSKPAVKGSYLDVPVYDLTGQEVSTVTLPKEVFGIDASPDLLAQYVHVYRVNARQGNAASKTRAEVIGTTKKIYKQKGTGRARHGAKKAPIFVGGGVTFGPQPRNFSLKITKKQKRKAFLGALTLKAKNHAIAVLSQQFASMEPKTKQMAGFFKNAGYEYDSTLVILPKMEKNGLILSSRNLPDIEVTSLESLNAYDALKYKRLLFTEDSIEKLTKMYAS